MENNKKNVKRRSKNLKGGYGSIYSLIPGTLSGPYNKNYLAWHTIPVGTLVLRTANTYVNDICVVVKQNNDWEGFSNYGPVYTIRDFLHNQMSVTSYDFRVLVIMKSFIINSKKDFQIGMISGIYINNIKTFHVMILDENSVKYRLYNNYDIKELNDIEYISSDDIENIYKEGYTQTLKDILYDFLHNVIAHPLKNVLLSLYRRDDDIYNEWILTNIQNMQDMQDVYNSGNYTPPPFGSYSRQGPSSPPFGTDSRQGPSPPPFGSYSRQGPSPPPFGSYSRQGPSSPRGSKGSRNSRHTTPPPPGPQRSSPSPPQNEDDIKYTYANILIKIYFINASDLSKEDFETLFDKQQGEDKIEDILIKIAGKNYISTFKKSFRKAILELHPDKININIEKIKKNIIGDFNQQTLNNSVDTVVKMLNIIKNKGQSGGKISLYKKVYSKNILGKNRAIYKIGGSNKEYVKRKGVYISVIEYKNLVNKKLP